MQTLIDLTHSTPNFSYYGTLPTWLIAASITRDSDTIERSNWNVIQSRLAELPTDTDIDTFTIISTSHWLCGWVDYLIINPAATEAIALVEALHERLVDYPILSDEDCSELEYTEMWEELEDIDSQLKDYGHCSDSPIVWNSENGYTYTTLCATCGEEFLYQSDSQSYPTIEQCSIAAEGE